MGNATVSEPFPVFELAGRYLLYDVDTVMHARTQHHICGVLIGNLPSANQQNVFSGIPLELMPEEARLLVEEKHAYIVDDVEMHTRGLQNLSLEERRNFREQLKEQGLEAARAIQQVAEAKKLHGLARMARRKAKSKMLHTPEEDGSPKSDDILFGTSEGATSSLLQQPGRPLEPQLISPTSSYPPLRIIPSDISSAMPSAPSSYALFKYLHNKGYWMTPGLRFGCQYSIYPGDPLRFHSHFLGVNVGWDEEIDLLHIVGGGRLGTGVKKGYLIGGREPKDGSIEPEVDREGNVRTFCIEWAVM